LFQLAVLVLQATFELLQSHGHNSSGTTNPVVVGAFRKWFHDRFVFMVDWFAQNWLAFAALVLAIPGALAVVVPALKRWNRRHRRGLKVTIAEQAQAQVFINGKLTPILRPMLHIDVHNPGPQLSFECWLRRRGDKRRYLPKNTDRFKTQNSKVGRGQTKTITRNPRELAHVILEAGGSGVAEIYAEVADAQGRQFRSKSRLILVEELAKEYDVEQSEREQARADVAKMVEGFRILPGLSDDVARSLMKKPTD
jgi:hypothetical protein